ncbi:hypothetical protein E2C01_101775 [Portunus trituberculatus]|uniref:Uncharacterized protein n=1 Tax=Portunus trituberculatus TaxID=210409 RepID=A0A5B7KKW9_PORTR|nr:hypothetical protein [Portunus trituberculatus]
MERPSPHQPPAAWRLGAGWGNGGGREGGETFPGGAQSAHRPATPLNTTPPHPSLGEFTFHLLLFPI